MKSIKWMLFGITLLLVTFLIRCMLEDALYTDFIGIFGAIIVIYGMCFSMDTLFPKSIQ